MADSRRKTQQKIADADKRNTVASRRKAPPKRRTLKERREDMLIISSASQLDIYIWALSMALMVGVLVTFVVCALLIKAS